MKNQPTGLMMNTGKGQSLNLVEIESLKQPSSVISKGSAEILPLSRHNSVN